MPTLQEVFRSIMQRVARREVRAVMQPIRRDLRALRRKVAGLPETVRGLSRDVGTLVRDRDAGRAGLHASSEEVRAARISPGLIQKLRRRLKLTQGQLAKLAGVSAVAVQGWEAGRSRPQDARRAALVALRKLGRREVVRLLAALPEVKRPRRPARRRARRRRTAR